MDIITIFLFTIATPFFSEDHRSYRKYYRQELVYHAATIMGKESNASEKIVQEEEAWPICWARTIFFAYVLAFFEIS